MHDVEGMNAVSKWCDTGGAQRYEGFAMNGEISLRMEIGPLPRPVHNFLQSLCCSRSLRQASKRGKGRDMGSYSLQRDPCYMDALYYEANRSSTMNTPSN
ncbi:hypothetical protein VNO77_34528 [Canavalia gladiata]|uniref:Uncharacterized protein n=1 Tax=Canavalia gladiata TaxID=3824 RepID=A0AAN9KFN6_CANGL